MQAKTWIYIINRIFSAYKNDFPVDENRSPRAAFLDDQSASFFTEKECKVPYTYPSLHWTHTN